MKHANIRVGRLWCALGLSCGWWGCAAQGGSETGNPVVAFANAGCDGDLSELKAGPGSAPRLSDPPQDLGLYCIAWEVAQTGELLLEIRNLEGECAVDWQPAGEIHDGGLELRLEKAAECDVRAGCLPCSYDLGFEIDGIDSAAPLPLSLWTREDCDPAELRTQVTLPLDEQPEGILCRAMENAPGTESLACDGGRFAACGEAVFCGNEAGTCGPSLTCGALTSGALQRCLPSCGDDMDCEDDAAFLACDEGLCRLDPARSF